MTILKINTLVVMICMMSTTLFAQIKGRYDCEYCGHYEGMSTRGDSAETNLVIVRLELYSDSTYGFEVGGVFSWCSSMVFTGQGKWMADSNWIYFKPDSIYGGNFVMIVPGLYTSDDHTDFRRATRYYSQGYTKALRIEHQSFACYTIAVDLDWDCLENSWTDQPIKNRNCK